MANFLKGKKVLEVMSGNGFFSRMLKEKGHTVIDCTCENAVKQLSGIVSKANAQALDVFCSIHLNAGGGHGTETYIWNGSWSAKESNRAIAKRVNDLVVASCGFKNRGVKEANFYVLKETVAPAILVEVCFVDSQEDANKRYPGRKEYL